MARIRDARMEDLPEMLDIFGYYLRNTAVHFSYESPELPEYQKWFEKITSRYPWLAAEEDGEVLGFAYAGPFIEREAYDWSSELTIYIRPEKRRAGLGKRLYEELEERLKAMGIVNLYAFVARPDQEDEYLPPDSVLFHERQGFRTNAEFPKCGRKFGRWYSVIWMEKVIGEHLDDQPPVKRYVPSAQ